LINNFPQTNRTALNNWKIVWINIVLTFRPQFSTCRIAVQKTKELCEKLRGICNFLIKRKSQQQQATRCHLRLSHTILIFIFQVSEVQQSTKYKKKKKRREKTDEKLYKNKYEKENRGEKEKSLKTPKAKVHIKQPKKVFQLL